MRLAVLLLLATATGASAGARQDFSQSTIAFVPQAPVEGDLVEMTLHLRNSGADSALHADMEATIPVAALFVDVTGLDGAIADLEARTVRWTGQLDPGASRQAVVRLIIPNDAGGESLASTMQVRYLYGGAESRVHAQKQIGTRLPTGGVPLGRFRMTSAEMILLGWIAGSILFYLAVVAIAPRRARPLPAVAAIVISSGFLTIFASMAWYDWRVLRAYRETPCTILDSRVRFETARTAPAGGRASTTARTSTTASPLLALRYEADGAERISTGFGTRSDLQIGGAARAAVAMNNWSTGTVVPCWYDPVDPHRVVVRRGFGGAYLFALLPLPVFVFGVWGLRATAGSAR